MRCILENAVFGNLIWVYNVAILGVYNRCFYFIYSRRKKFSETESKHNGFFCGVRNVASKRNCFGQLWLVLAQNSSHNSQKMKQHGVSSSSLLRQIFAKSSFILNIP